LGRIKALCRSVKINDFTGKEIDEKGGSEKSFIPEFQWHGCMRKKSKTHFNDVTVFAFSRTILLMGMRT
jgi:hypothetical protein